MRDRTAPTVLTPHDGEFAQLTGTPPGADRLAAARALATRLGCTVLLKGPATVVADETGDVLVVDNGDERLATAGTGDVLAGMIGALLAAGRAPLHAAAAGAGCTRTPLDAGRAWAWWRAMYPTCCPPRSPPRSPG